MNREKNPDARKGRAGEVRSILDMLDSAIWSGKHAALVLGWTDDQLAPVGEALEPLLPSHLPGAPEKIITPGMRLAIAACARSLVVDFQVTGQPVHYSRNRNHYSIPERYRRGDSHYYTWYFVTHAVDVLVEAGLAGHDLGVWLSSSGGNRESVAWPTTKLLAAVTPVIDIREPRGNPRHAEVIVLRDREDKRDIGYEDTAETIAMRAEVQALNDALSQLELSLHGRALPIPLIRRVFNGDFTRGGRSYCHGASFQNIPAQDRLELEVHIDAALHSVVEIDYANLHAVIAYHEADLPMPSGDQYTIDGFDRAVIKRAFNVMLNARARHEAVAALSEDIHRKDVELWKRSGLPTRHRKQTRPYAEKVVAAIEDRHHQISDSFSSDCGARFQRKDSDMAIRVMQKMIERTGRCPLPVHDSFLVADIDQEALAATMKEVASEEGLQLCLKTAGHPAR